MTAFPAGARVQITGRRNHAGQRGEVTKVNGPKTREIRLDAGFTLWSVKVADLTEDPAAVFCHACDFAHSATFAGCLAYGTENPK
jgi:hypothetical protein